MDIPKILVVDDEQDMELMLTTHFDQDGYAEKYRFLFAGDGQEALRQLAADPEILVVVTDIKMPKMDGLQLLEKLHHHYPLICPIIVSAFSTMPHIRTAMNRGAYDFLEKPFTFEDIERTLDKAIRHVTEILRQIRERQQAKDALKQSEEQYRLLAETVSDGLAIVQEDRLIFANATLYAMFGETPDHLRNGYSKLLMKPNGPDSRVDTGESVPSSWHRQYIKQDGCDLWLEICRSEIHWSGKPADLLTIRDITTHKQHELALKAQTQRIRRENLALKGMIWTHERFGDLVGRSQAMQQVYDMILRAAENERPIVIAGESGTGKELVAKTIWQLSPQRDKPFVPVNCGAIPESLIESELFGYRKGAFTGAQSDKPGLFDQAQGGTLFLDEVGDLSFASQVKLLRVLETGEYTPVGGTAVKRSDARILAATHRNLFEMAQAGQFREDLFYRLHVIEITVPPLRERMEDLPLLIDFFLEHLAGSEYQQALPRDFLTQLHAHHWPGNIRELHNVLCRYITTGELSFAGSCSDISHTNTDIVNRQGKNFQELIQAFEASVLKQALEQHNWDRQKTAAMLGMAPRTFRRKIREYQIVAPYQKHS